MPYHCAHAAYILSRSPVWYNRAMDKNPPIDVEEVPPIMSGGVVVPRVTSEIIDISPEKNTPEEPALPPLTVEQDMFALAYIEECGDVRAAYRAVYGKDAPTPTARGLQMLSLPQVTARVAELSDSIKEAALVSVGIHLQELANIRELAKAQGQLKVALQAERNRGEVGGLYKNAIAPPSTVVQVAFVSKHDNNI